MSGPRPDGGNRVHGTMLQLGERELDTIHGRFRAHLFQNLLTRRYAIAVACGDLSAPEPVLTRVHSACVTSETYGACDCDCAQQLDSALARVAEAGRGAVFYLMQEGRGAGLAAKARDRMLVQASRDRLSTFEAYERMGLLRDYRRYDEVAFMRRLLGSSAPVALLTSNPEKAAALEREGVAVERVIPLLHEVSPFNLHYIAAKRRSGHALGAPDVRLEPAALPEPVTSFAPYPLEEAPRFIHMATYLLPIRRPGAGADADPYWFKLHAYFDLAVSRERVILCYGDVGNGESGGSSADGPDGEAPLFRVQREALLERFPLRDEGLLKGSWRRSVERIVERGRGCAMFLPAGGDIVGGGPGALSPAVAAALGADASAEPDDAVWWLLARHLGPVPAQPLFDGSETRGSVAAMRRALSRHGVETLDPDRVETAPA